MASLSTLHHAMHHRTCPTRIVLWVTAVLTLTVTMQKPKAAGEKKPKTTKPKVSHKLPQAQTDILTVNNALEDPNLCPTCAARYAKGHPLCVWRRSVYICQQPFQACSDGAARERCQHRSSDLLHAMQVKKPKAAKPAAAAAPAEGAAPAAEKPKVHTKSASSKLPCLGVLLCSQCRICKVCMLMRLYG